MDHMAIDFDRRDVSAVHLNDIKGLEDEDPDFDADDAAEDTSEEDHDKVEILFARLKNVSISDIPNGYSVKQFVMNESGLRDRPGMDLEPVDSDFIRLTNILQHISGVYSLKGVLFGRIRRVSRMLLTRLDEICALLNKNLDAP